MLEVINGFLLLYFVILCTLSALVPYLVKPIATCFSRPSSEEYEMKTEIAKLRDEQDKLSIKDDFAAYSKVQRKINKFEEQLKDYSQSRASKRLAIKGVVHLVLQVIVALAIIISVIWFRREPIVLLKGNLFPLTSFLSYPSDMPNAVSTHVWVILSNFSIRTLIKPLVA